MTGLMVELAGKDFAEKYKSSHITSCKVNKENMTMHVEISSDVFPCVLPLEELKSKIIQKFGVLNACFSITYKDFELTQDNLLAFYESVREILCQDNKSLSNILAGSTAELIDKTLNIHLKFGGEKTLLAQKVDHLAQSVIHSAFGKTLNVTFSGNTKNETEIFEKLENERKKMVAGSSEIANKVKERTPVKTVTKVKDAEEKENHILIGRDFSGEIAKMQDINEYSGKVIVSGKIITSEIKEIKNDKVIFFVYITDGTGSVTCKTFLENAKYKEMKDKLKSAKALCVRGLAQFDSFEREVTIKIDDMKIIPTAQKHDNAEEKRVELHAHTVMSAMDSVAKTDELIKLAASWGHKAIAITDHGVVQAYPDAFSAGEKNGIKIIYGMEGYLMGESAKLVYNEKSMPLTGSFVVFDIETTGLSAKFNEIIEIAGVKIENGRITERFSKFIRPSSSIPAHITELTRITNDMVKDAAPVESVLKDFLEFADGCALVAHNATFDVGFLEKNCERLHLPFDFCYIDTLGLSRRFVKKIKRHRLNNVAKALGFTFDGHHRAINDAEITAKIFITFIEMMKRENIQDVSQINAQLMDESIVKYTDLYHIILLAKNMTGLQNLYKLVSTSHLDNFYKKPRLSRETLDKHRDGLIIGSACEAGELYSSILSGKRIDYIETIANYYDYLEIQPLGNNAFMLRNQTLSSEEDLIEINREIITLGEKLKKPVVATCDVHFIHPEDAIYREVLFTGQDYEDAANQAPLYLRTTEEMLEEFSYLGKKKAYEIVVQNTNLIADMVESIRPIPKETYPPEMPGATEDIQRMSEEKAHELYGDELPKIVRERMDKELVPIIKYGFSVMYMIAQKLVTKSLSDGYLVGSRGSVGSSFIAYLIGITEINSLPPHYICRHCKNVEFVTDGTFGCGADMPDKICPVCGAHYAKEGYDIPFETFLGFDGDKEPDIDLNFSGEYQSVAHKYTEELFGVGHVYRAGTIGTFAENTAFGYVKKYSEKKEKILNKAETMRLVNGIVGVKRTTGQHPGGVMIVPKANEIYQFSPIQHPANDNDTDIITTHFDYHSISGKLLKLDILGHDDPTMIRMLEDLTGLDAKTIPIDDKETMSLFTGTEALGATPEEIGSIVGTYAVPEFGTKFVRQMLIDTKPTTFGELMRISGLSHGTDVWTNNAQDLVRDGVATLSQVICTRDDIMLYLLHHGLPPLNSFKIMEKVRKGKGLEPDDEKLMRENGVPEWYITSCKTIKYMFPKAHAAAYVTMAFRIAYFKVHYPIAFYLTYFTVRATEFDADLMLRGKEHVVSALAELNQKQDLTQKDKNLITILEVVNEMYARKITFLPVDLYKSDAVKFMEEDGAIRPPLNAINGISDAIGQSIVTARNSGGPFLSVEELMKRAKIGAAVVEKMKEYDILKDIPDTNQVSLFDI